MTQTELRFTVEGSDSVAVPEQGGARGPASTSQAEVRETNGACTPGTALLSRGPHPSATAGAAGVPQCGDPSVHTGSSEAGTDFSK